MCDDDDDDQIIFFFLSVEEKKMSPRLIHYYAMIAVLFISFMINMLFSFCQNIFSSSSDV